MRVKILQKGNLLQLKQSRFPREIIHSLRTMEKPSAAQILYAMRMPLI